jgi:polar amino acid transport system substrate-binding protein
MCLSWWVPVAQSTQVLQLISTDVRPWGYIDREGKPGGIHVDMLQGLAAKNGALGVIRVVPYVRLIREIKQGSADIAVMFDSAESRDVAHLLAAIDPVKVLMVTRSKLTWSEFLESGQLKIGRLRQSRYGMSQSSLKDSDFVDINTVNQGVAMLLKGRLDGMLCTAPALSIAFENLDVDTLGSLQAFYVSEIRSGIFLSKQSRLNKNALMGRASDVIRDYRRELKLWGRDLSDMTILDVSRKLNE